MKKYIGLSIIALSLGLTSCNDWLDKLPDNRMELKTPEDITDLLTSAYPETHPAYLLEMYSDNADLCDNNGWDEADRFQRQAWQWDDITEIRDDESPQELWNKHYSAIAAANAAIEHIDGLDPVEASQYSAQLGEALLCRAYAMFQLSTVFCNAYDPSTANTEKGLPYPTATERRVGEVYERGTLAELYENIDADIQRALPLVKNAYSHPKFHFTPNAAFAFAARFYLNYQKYEKRADYTENAYIAHIKICRPFRVKRAAYGGQKGPVGAVQYSVNAEAHIHYKRCYKQRQPRQLRYRADLKALVKVLFSVPGPYHITVSKPRNIERLPDKHYQYYKTKEL